MLNVLLGLVPVLVFLAILILMDSFKLVPLRSLLAALLAGCLAALFCSFLNGWILEASAISTVAFSRYGAPLIEELVKSGYVAQLILRKRVGFLVDAAIAGFAVGAGFALFENVHYLLNLESSSALLWVVRGFGTAIVHGSNTAIFAMLAKGPAQRHPEGRLRVLLPGLAVAVAMHSLFNHFVLNPLLTTALLLVVLPLLTIVVFERSQQATHAWLSAGLADDAELLDAILSGGVSETRAGAYLHSLKTRFPGPVVADMLCLVRIHLELSLQGKGILIAREAGVRVPLGREIGANLDELRYLERAIGATGLLAIKPLLKHESRDLWHLHLLDKSRATGERSATGRRGGGTG